jgi:SAM-dependent methyltransferase
VFNAATSVLKMGASALANAATLTAPVLAQAQSVSSALPFMRKVLAVARASGVGAVVRRAKDSVADRYSRWLDARFDRRYGIDTCGIHENLAALGAGGEHLADAQPYEPIQFPVFRAIMRTCEIDPGSYTFVDFGSGKGRALVLAAQYGFKRMIGVEFAPGLHELAQRNVKAFHGRCPLAGCIELHCGDAVDLEIPDGDAFLWFYNPFGERVLRKVAANIERSYRARRRRLLIAYRNAVHSSVLDELTFMQAVVRDKSFTLYRAEPARLRQH